MRTLLLSLLSVSLISCSSLSPQPLEEAEMHKYIEIEYSCRIKTQNNIDYKLCVERELHVR